MGWGAVIRVGGVISDLERMKPAGPSSDPALELISKALLTAVLTATAWT